MKFYIQELSPQGDTTVGEIVWLLFIIVFFIVNIITIIAFVAEGFSEQVLRGSVLWVFSLAMAYVRVENVGDEK